MPVIPDGSLAKHIRAVKWWLLDIEALLFPFVFLFLEAGRLLDFPFNFLPQVSLRFGTG
jgi:hypothetical protein